MELRFGHDLGRVRIHTDQRAAESAAAVDATAYTVGRHVVFAQGRYAPETPRGRELLAHELTHSIQQGLRAHIPSVLPIGDPHHPQEGQARRVASMTEAAVPMGAAADWEGAVVAREPRKPQQPAPEAGPCPGGMKTVSVDLVSLRGSNRNAPADLDFANTVYRACCVQFALGTGVTVTPTLSDTWLGGDTDLQTGTCGSPTGEELNAFNGGSTQFHLSGRLRAFYAETISSGNRADSYPPYCATGAAAPLAGMASISNSAAPRTLAHEFGHILLNSAVHPPDTNNLMHETNSATGEHLTPEQCATIYANA